MTSKTEHVKISGNVVRKPMDYPHGWSDNTGKGEVNLCVQYTGAVGKSLNDIAGYIELSFNTHQALLDALQQWKNAEAAGDVEELENARMSRDAAIQAATN